MQYYLISLIISVIIFGIIQFYEYRKKQNEENEYYYEPYQLFTINNCLVFGIIYLVITIISYYIYSSNLNILPFTIINNGGAKIKNIEPNVNTNQDNNIKEDINPQILSKINDNFDIGLDPFNSDNDDISDSDISSISSKSSIS